jgi:hypothetical protein
MEMHLIFDLHPVANMRTWSISLWPSPQYVTLMMLRPLNEFSEHGYNYSRLLDTYVQHELLAKDDYVKRNLVELHVYLESNEINVIQEVKQVGIGALTFDVTVIGLMGRRAVVFPSVSRFDRWSHSL